MALTNFREFAEPPLAFPIGDKTYTVPPVGITVGLKLAGVILGDDTELAQLPATEIWKMVLGPAWDEMIADDVPILAVSRAGMAALADFQGGRSIAEQIWNSELDPEALAANTAAPRTPKSTDAATTTPRRTSTSGTSSPKGKSRAK